MWMKDKEGLIACLYGPCEMETNMKGQKVFMRETTSYPHDFAIDFEITVDQPIDFVLKLRKPSWTKSIKLNVPFADMGKVICIDKRWTGVEK